MKTFVAALFLCASVLAQGSWTPVPTAQPFDLTSHAMAYDFNRQKTVMFGGFNHFYTTQGITHEFDGFTWMQRVTANFPSPRAGHAMCYDIARSKIVMFGGTSTIFGQYVPANVWEYDGVDWVMLPHLVFPSPRVDHTMVYDLSLLKTVMFGGRQSVNNPFGDTWFWDGVSWVQSPALGPPGRHGHAMAYDIVRQRSVLFGGKSGLSLLGNFLSLDDTWEFDGVTWVQLASLVPAARASHRMVYDMHRNVCVMHGGSNRGDETWDWDGNVWTLHQAPSAIDRYGFAMSYDAHFLCPVFHGGVGGNPILVRGDTQTFSIRVPGSYVQQGTSCPGGAGLPVLFEPNAQATGPMIGQTSTIVVSPVFDQTFYVFGFSNTLDGSTTLPCSLLPYGMPGCSLYVSREAVTSSFPILGTSTLAVSIPYNPFLVGTVFYVQAFPVEFGINPMGFLATNYLVASVGRQ